MSESYDAIVVLAHGRPEEDGRVDEETRLRVETGAAHYQAGEADLFVVSGNAPLKVTPGEEPSAYGMKREAVQLGIPEDAILQEPFSLDTVGNAYFTKKTILEPRGLQDILLVTSPSHLPRSVGAFRHVLGPDYTVEGAASAPGPRPAQRIYETAGLVLRHMLLDGTAPGDDEAIWRRMQLLIPGYREEKGMRFIRQYVRQSLRNMMPGRA